MAQECLHCSTPLPPRQGRGRPRRYCDRRCWQTAENNRRRAARDARPRSCDYCGEHVPLGRNRRNGHLFCSTTCSVRHRAGVVVVERTCPRCGTGFTATERALKTYCTKACQVANNRERTTRSTTPRPCKQCGHTFAARPKQVYCTDACRLAGFSADRTGRLHPRRRWPQTHVTIRECAHCTRLYVRPGRLVGTWGGGVDEVGGVPAQVGGLPPKPGGGVRYCGGDCAREAQRKANGWAERGTIATRSCRRCQQPFAHHVATRVPDYCDACRPDVVRDHRHASKQRRRAYKRNTSSRGERIFRSRIYERDRWTCQLCHRHVDRQLSYPNPWSASLDHVVPLAVGGEHTAANVQLAHLRCNLRKGARRGRPQQLALVG